MFFRQQTTAGDYRFNEVTHQQGPQRHHQIPEGQTLMGRSPIVLVVTDKTDDLGLSDQGNEDWRRRLGHFPSQYMEGRQNEDEPGNCQRNRIYAV